MKSYIETEGGPVILRRAKALETILENIPIAVGEDELVIGGRTVLSRMGVPAVEGAVDWLEKELDTIGTREQEPFEITAEDKQVLREEVLPFFRGKTLKDYLCGALSTDVMEPVEEGIYTLNQTTHSQGHILPDTKKWLSKGIGGGLVVDGRIINGKNDLTGEIWALPVMNMGRPEILLNSASGQGIVKNYREFLKKTGRPENPQPKNKSPKDALDAAGRGDEAADAVLKNAVDCMADAVLAILYIIDPHIVLFGGGLTAGNSSIVELIRERVKSGLFFKSHANTPIERALLWDDAVLYGALSLFGEYRVYPLLGITSTARHSYSTKY